MCLLLSLKNAFPEKNIKNILIVLMLQHYWVKVIFKPACRFGDHNFNDFFSQK